MSSYIIIFYTMFQSVTQIIKIRHLYIIVFAMCAIKLQILLLNYKEFGDESENIVTVKMMKEGAILYSQVYSMHGPLSYLSGYIIEFIGKSGVIEHRIPILVLQIVTIGAIYSSPLLIESMWRRLYILTACGVLLLYLPEYFSHTYSYQVMCGLFISIILCQYTLPNIIVKDKVSVFATIISSFLLWCLPFLAITFAPLTILFFAASLRRQRLWASLGGAALAIVFNFAWLALVGSPTGLIAYYVYLNAVIYPVFNPSLGKLELIMAPLRSLTATLPGWSCIILFIAVFKTLATREGGIPWRTLAVIAGICNLLVRDIQLEMNAIHAIPFFHALLVLPLVLVYNSAYVTVVFRIISITIQSIIWFKILLLDQRDVNRLAAQPIPVQTEFSELVNNITEKNDKIIAYTYRNIEYIITDRLPASSHPNYMPWHSLYNSKPILNINRDACIDISQNLPKIMLIDKWKVWDLYDWDNYAECINIIIKNNYTKLFSTTYYLRNDISEETRLELITLDKSPKSLVPSSQLQGVGSIRIYSPVVLGDRSMVQVGIMFGTYSRRNTGEAAIIFVNQDGKEIREKLVIDRLRNNLYEYIDVPAGAVRVTGIVGVSGSGGISTWESHGDGGEVATCMNYKFEDGSRSFTPGCPLF